MPSTYVVVVVTVLALLVPRLSAAQDPARSSAGAGVGAGSDAGQAAASTATTAPSAAAARERAELERYGPSRFVRSLTNVQIELTITDQGGTGAPEKKTVTMVVSSGAWGKIRSVGSVRPVGDAPYGVDLNVDARPFVSVDGPIQLELTLNYAPPQSVENAKGRPTGVNQSLTVVLQSGKPLIVSQAADPVSDRKIIVEAKATVLK